MEDSWVMTDAGIRFLAKQHPGIVAKMALTEAGKLLLIPVVIGVITLGVAACLGIWQMRKNRRNSLLKGEDL